MERKFQIYLDLDGVFADFDGGFKKITGNFPKEVAKKFLWKTIYDADHFFYNLEVIKESKKLWNYVKELKPIFLTGLPSSIEGRDDKVRWVHKHYGQEYEVIVLPKKDKRKYANENSILIDDTKSNIIEWNADNGIGIYHEDDYDKTLDELKNILKEQFNWS
jgi:hypothetical protein